MMGNGLIIGRCPEDMVFVPGGTFLMGNHEHEEASVLSFLPSDARPVHPVTISSFCMDKYEFNYQGLPLRNITWYQADRFCKVNGKRLSTEAEWEYAARGRSHKDKYATVSGQLNTGISAQANHDNYPLTFTPTLKDVGSYRPNSWGLYDLSGNLAEWTADWYGPYSGEIQINPTGPDLGERKVIRGGSYKSIIGSVLEASARASYYPSIPSFDVGFRCAADPK